MNLFRIGALFLLAGCGYHAHEGEGSPISISVPFVSGDNEGQLTSEIVRALSRSGRFECVSAGGDYLLQVATVHDAQDRIGFQYDRKEFSGKRLGNLQATENRRTVVVEVSLIDTRSGLAVLGPTKVSANSEYDYVDTNSIKDLSFVTSSGRRESVLDFSIGQLDSVEGAQDDALLALYRHLANKIVAGLTSVPLDR